MVEPTETETRESLDALADAFEAILAEAERRPGDPPRGALHDPGPPPRRGAAASRKPVARQPLD